MRFSATLAGMLLTVLLTVVPAQAQKRVALVVGNDRYVELPQLRNAVADARSMALVLEELQFRVFKGENLDYRGTNRLHADFEAALAPGDTAFVFFAGHGVAIGADNYLLPVDMLKPKVGEENFVRTESHSIDLLVRRVQTKGVLTSFFVIDACRDNPFEAVGVRSIGAARGLARVDAPTGVFVLFSAGIGQTALDRLNAGDATPNFVFTRTLVPLLRQPGMSHIALAKRVQSEVRALAATVSHPQQPAFYDQIDGKIIFKTVAQSADSARPPAVQTPALDPDASARRDYEFAEKIGTKDAWEAFLARHPGGYYANLARSQLSKLALVAPPVAPVPPPTIVQPAVGVFDQTRRAAPLTAAEERALKPKDVFKKCDACPEMVVVPSGSFTMGSPQNELERRDSEGPQHQVTFAKPFAVGKFAVTFDDWDACVADGGCNGYQPSDQGWGRGRLPVINVSWNDAKTYLAWLSRKTGKTYRLLSESEREYVTRAGTTTPFWWGSSISTGQANYDGNFTYSSGSKGEYRQRTLPVHSFQSNPWGLYQVHGNVLEWTEDCWNASYSGAATDGSARTGGDCGSRVLRGGSWNGYPQSLRSAYRFGYVADGRGDIGFRVGRTLSITP